MGKYLQGILGAFTGKVGTVVGSSWRGISYMRSLTRRRGNANATDKQLEQQARFALVNGFLKPMKPLLEIGFKNYANGKTGYNSATSYNLKNALTGQTPNLEIDYTMVMLSRGDLPQVEGLAATSVTAAKLNLEWLDNSGRGKAKAEDQLILVAFCPDLAEAVYVIGEATRLATTYVFDLPSDYSTKEVHVYVGWISENGKEIANSKYAGNILIV